MEELLRKYAIPEGLSPKETLALLEKEKQRILRKLNHVVGLPEKEGPLTKELESLEALVAKLESQGGKISFDDVLPITRNLSQPSVNAESTPKENIRKMEEQLLAPNVFISDVHETLDTSENETLH